MVLFYLFFLLCTTIRPKLRVFIDLFFILAHDHSTKLHGPLSFILSLCTSIRSKIRVLINFFFLFEHNHSTKVRQESLLLFKLFFPELCQYFVCYIHDSTALIFPTLYSWQYCLYISSAIFIALLSLYFVHYIHGIAALMFRTLYSCLHEVCPFSSLNSLPRIGVPDSRIG